MVSWTIPLAYTVGKMQMAIHSLTDPFRTANCLDNDKYFKNNIICGSFYQRYSLILSLPSKLRHDF